MKFNWQMFRYTAYITWVCAVALFAAVMVLIGFVKFVLAFPQQAAIAIGAVVVFLLPAIYVGFANRESGTAGESPK